MCITVASNFLILLHAGSMCVLSFVLFSAFCGSVIAVFFLLFQKCLLMHRTLIVPYLSPQYNSNIPTNLRYSQPFNGLSMGLHASSSPFMHSQNAGICKYKFSCACACARIYKRACVLEFSCYSSSHSFVKTYKNGNGKIE